MARKVIATGEVKILIDELLTILLEKQYFSYREDARKYVDKLINYTEQYIGILPGRNAPEYFDRYGSNMKYITYRANKATVWYIFYQQLGNLFLVRHITNNHVAAQYF